MPNLNTIATVVTGSAFDLPLQLVLRPTGAPWSFGNGDTLQGYVYQGRPVSWAYPPPIYVFQATVTPYTRNNTQNGFGQGQVVFSGTPTQSALLVPGVGYTIGIWWAPSTNPTYLACVGRGALIVEGPSVY
jgi:hypothetical protein